MAQRFALCCRLVTEPSTGTQRLADLLLQPLGLRQYLAEKREQGLGYEQIARDLFADTQGEVSISYQTVKRWLVDLELMEAAS